MTKQELNRDIKRLWKEYKADRDRDTNTSNWTEKDWNNHEMKEARFRAEWLRLWNADRSAEYMKIEQLKAMLLINGVMRNKELHNMHHEYAPKL